MIRFLADADLNERIVAGCQRQEPAIDFLSANKARLEGMPDSEVLALAAAQDRILVSHDFRTMPRHFGKFVESHGSSPGVLLLPQHVPISEAIEDLLLIWSASDQQDWQNRILRIPLL